MVNLYLSVYHCTGQSIWNLTIIFAWWGFDLHLIIVMQILISILRVQIQQGLIEIWLWIGF